MNIIESGKKDAVATGDRFVPQRDATNADRWCVVDTHTGTIVSLGLRFENALEYAKNLSAVNNLPRANALRQAVSAEPREFLLSRS